MPMEREYPWMVLINAPLDFLRCLLKLLRVGRSGGELRVLRGLLVKVLE